MDIKYRQLLSENKLTLKSEVLHPSFVSKAEEFEQKLGSNQLTDDEIKALDAELVSMFESLHDFSEEDSEEVTRVKHATDVANARANIAETNTVEDLTKLKTVYKDLSEVLPIIDAKITKLNDVAAKEQERQRQIEEQRQQQAQAQIITSAKGEISAAKYEALQSLKVKFKDYPELVKIIDDRIAAEKPGKDDEELKAKLLSKKEWGYAALREIGVKPTGNNMTVAGVRLEKEYLLDVYAVIR